MMLDPDEMLAAGTGEAAAQLQQVGFVSCSIVPVAWDPGSCFICWTRTRCGRLPRKKKQWRLRRLGLY